MLPGNAVEEAFNVFRHFDAKFFGFRVKPISLSVAAASVPSISEKGPKKSHPIK